MAKQVVLLSVHICFGKTTLCRHLETRFGVTVLRTKDWIRELEVKAKAERRSMQKHGESLDRKTGGQWVCDVLAQKANELPEDAIIVLDAVRIAPT